MGFFEFVGCTGMSDGKNFPEFEKLIEEMFYSNGAKLWFVKNVLFLCGIW